MLDRAPSACSQRARKTVERPLLGGPLGRRASVPHALSGICHRQAESRQDRNGKRSGTSNPRSTVNEHAVATPQSIRNLSRELEEGRVIIRALIVTNG